MFLLYLIYAAIFFAVIYFLATQVVMPLIDGTRLFPYFTSDKKTSALTELKEVRNALKEKNAECDETIHVMDDIVKEHVKQLANQKRIASIDEVVKQAQK